MPKERKTIKSMVVPQLSSEGGGMRWKRSISLPGMDYLDPILSFDHFQRTDDFHRYYQKTQKRYLGMQMITYLINGKYHFRSAKKEMGSLTAGSLVWIKSGSGIDLEEVYETDQKNLEGFQIWINLPAINKNDLPQFNLLESQKIPVVRQNDASLIRVLVGDYQKANSSIIVEQPKINLFDLLIPPYANFSMQSKYIQSLVYLYQGRGYFGKYGDEEDILVSRQKLLIYGPGDFISVRTEETPLRMLYLSAEPIQEPIVRYGSFVMNNQDEIKRYFSEP